MAKPRTAKEYKEWLNNLKKKGFDISLLPKNITQQRKKVTELNKLARELSYPRGHKQYLEEEADEVENKKQRRSPTKRWKW